MAPALRTSARGCHEPRLATVRNVAGCLLLLAACSGGGGGSDYSVDVTPSSLSFAAERYGPLPDRQLLTATFDGEGLLVGWPAGTTAPSWLDVSMEGSSGRTATVGVRVTTTHLSPAVYSATIRFVTGKSDGSDYVVRDVPVSFRVTAPAYEIVGTRSVTVTHAARTSDLDLPLTLDTNLSAADGAACTWHIADDQPWIAVTPASGTLAADTPLLAHLDPDALWAMQNGPHRATLQVTLDAGCSRTTALQADVTLTLDLRPALTAPEVSFSVTELAATPYAQTVAVASNVGEAFAARAAWNASFAASWVTLSPTSGLGSGTIQLELTSAALSSLPTGDYAATLLITPADARVSGASPTVYLDLDVPTVEHLAPVTTWVGREAEVVIRGGGFAYFGATVPVQVGSQTLDATVVSDAELRLTVPAQATPGRLAVRVENSLGLDRGGAELVVLPEPAYAATSLQLAQRFDGMILDPERQAVLLTGYATGEILRLRFHDGMWVEEHAPLADAAGAAITVDGRRVLVFTGTVDASSAQAVVELDADTLATLSTASFSSIYEVYSLIAPLVDGRTLLVDSDQWSTLRWYPGFAQGPYLSVYGAQMLLTRDRSRLMLRPRYIDPYGTGQEIRSWDVADGAFQVRFKPAAWDQRTWDVSEDGGRMLDGLDVYDRHFVKLGSVVLPDPAPLNASLSPDGAAVYTISNVAETGYSWVLRRTNVSAASGPYAADASALPFVLPSTEHPLRMRVSEDGSTLFLVTFSVGSSEPTYYFRAVPLS